MFKTPIYFTIIVLLISSEAACDHGAEQRLEVKNITSGNKSNDRPFVFIYRTPVYPIPGKPMISGVLIAVWDDGKMVRTPPGHEVGQSYINCRIKPDAVSKLKQHLIDSDLSFDDPGGMVVVDAASTDLTIRVDGESLTWAHSPPQEVNAAITDIEQYLLSLEFDNVEQVDAAPYRIYPHSWYD